METTWVDKHSVNCYFCGHLIDEREGQNADNWNNNDGGTICDECMVVTPLTNTEKE